MVEVLDGHGQLGKEDQHHAEKELKRETVIQQRRSQSDFLFRLNVRCFEEAGVLLRGLRCISRTLMKNIGSPHISIHPLGPLDRKRRNHVSINANGDIQQGEDLGGKTAIWDIPAKMKMLKSIAVWSGRGLI